MSDRFPACLAFLWRGDTDGQALHLDPNDRGGATAYGITLATYTAWRQAHQHVTTTPADLAAASSADLADLVRAWYWMPPRCDALPAGMDLMALDLAFGSGVGFACRMVQRVAGVAEDGHVGPVTLAAAAQRPVAGMIEAMHAGWLAHCRAIPDPGGWPTYANGWTNRANKRLAAALGMVGTAGNSAVLAPSVLKDSLTTAAPPVVAHDGDALCQAAAARVEQDVRRLLGVAALPTSPTVPLATSATDALNDAELARHEKDL